MKKKRKKSNQQVRTRSFQQSQALRTGRKEVTMQITNANIPHYNKKIGSSRSQAIIRQQHHILWLNSTSIFQIYFQYNRLFLFNALFTLANVFALDRMKALVRSLSSFLGSVCAATVKRSANSDGQKPWKSAQPICFCLNHMFEYNEPKRTLWKSSNGTCTRKNNIMFQCYTFPPFELTWMTDF